MRIDVYSMDDEGWTSTSAVGVNTVLGHLNASEELSRDAAY